MAIDMGSCYGLLLWAIDMSRHHVQTSSPKSSLHQERNPHGDFNIADDQYFHFGCHAQKIAPNNTPHSAVTSAASTAADVIDTLFTSEEERLDKQAVLARIALHADALQTKIN